MYWWWVRGCLSRDGQAASGPFCGADSVDRKAIQAPVFISERILLSGSLAEGRSPFTCPDGRCGEEGLVWPGLSLPHGYLPLSTVPHQLLTNPYLLFTNFLYPLLDDYFTDIRKGRRTRQVVTCILRRFRSPGHEGSIPTYARQTRCVNEDLSNMMYLGQGCVLLRNRD